ncbi:MAG: hypothetical protein AAFX06_01880 [Planctomycetota bacterium]
MKLLLLNTLLFIALGSQVTSAGVLIGFDSLEAPGTSFSVFPNPLEIGGFRFAAVDGFNGVPGSFQQSSTFYNGSAALTATNSSNLLMTQINGATFSVASLDVDRLFSGASFEFIGEFAGGGTVIQTHTPDPFVPNSAVGNETVTLLGFENIVSLTLGAVGGQNFSNTGSVDNIQISAATVPEPYSMSAWMLATVIGLNRRRKRR